MKIYRRKHFSSLAFAFLPAFILLCGLFILISVTFCKEATPNTATDATSVDDPILIIDAGHGGEDGGTIGKNGVYEKDLNLQISQKLNEIAISCGYKTVMTRSEDILLYDRNVDYNGRKKALDLLARVKITQEYDNAIFVSIHMNAFPDSKYSGLQVYYSKNCEKSKEIAESIQNATREHLQPSNNRMIKAADSSIFVLDRITHPAVLIECGFLSNEEECSLLSSEEYQQKLALAIFSAVSKYIDTPT